MILTLRFRSWNTFTPPFTSTSFQLFSKDIQIFMLMSLGTSWPSKSSWTMMERKMQVIFIMTSIQTLIKRLRGPLLTLNRLRNSEKNFMNSSKFMRLWSRPMGQWQVHFNKGSPENLNIFTLRTTIEKVFIILGTAPFWVVVTYSKKFSKAKSYQNGWVMFQCKKESQFCLKYLGSSMSKSKAFN